MRAVLIGVGVAAGLGVLAFARGRADDKVEKVERVPTIQEIMEESHQCRTAHIRLVGQQLRKDDTDWSEVELKSKDLVRLGRLLAKNTPPRGSKASWGKLTDLYVSHATILTDAAERKDRETALHHQRKMQAMCATCHRAHRED